MDLSRNYIVLSATPELQEEMPMSGINLGDYMAIGVIIDENEGESTRIFNVGRLDMLTIAEDEEDDEYVEEYVVEYEISHPIIEGMDLYKEVDYFFIRLFEQDFYQMMIMEQKECNLYRLILDFNHFFFTEISSKGLTDLFDTMEKCWLAFYMSVIHEKRWGGKGWKMFKNT